jgi:hypothetical protein
MKLCSRDDHNKHQCMAYDMGTCLAKISCAEVVTELYGKGESDPYGKDQHEAGAKTDEGKPQASLLLLFGKALRAVARVGTFGAIKYTRGGWQSVPDGINRYNCSDTCFKKTMRSMTPIYLYSMLLRLRGTPSPD